MLKSSDILLKLCRQQKRKIYDSSRGRRSCLKEDQGKFHSLFARSTYQPATHTRKIDLMYQEALKVIFKLSSSSTKRLEALKE